MSQRTLGMGVVAGSEIVARDTVVIDVQIELASPPQSGQFAMVHPMVPGCLLPRPLSILDYEAGRMRLLVKDVGVGTSALCAMRGGERIRIFAPLGRSFPLDLAGDNPLVLVAGGVGLVPLHLLARERLAAGLSTATALFGAQTPADLPTNLLDGWQLWVEREPAAGMEQGLVTRGLEAALAAHTDAVVATCGPTPMMKAVARICADADRPLWLCLEEQMGCGAGVCRACVVPDADEPRMRTVCKDGPVFRAEEIEYV